MQQTVEDQLAAASPLTADPSPVRAAEAPARRPSGSWVGTVALVLVGVGLLAYGVRQGMPAASAARALLSITLTQVVPGVVVWRAVRPRDGWWFEDIGMGFAIGSALAVGAQVLAGLSGLAWLGAVVGPCLAVTLLLVRAARERVLAARTAPLPWWWGSSVALTCLVTLPIFQSGIRVQPLTWPSGARVPYIDAYFHLALSGGLAHRGPTRFPWVESEPMAYHWFSHAWVAQVSNTSGTGLDEVLFVLLPLVVPMLAVLVVACAAVRLSGRPWTGPVAAILMMAGGDLNVFGMATPGFPVSVLSPSLTFGAPLLIATVVVIAVRWRGELARGGALVLVVVATGAAGAKGSTIPLVLAGLALSAVAMAIVDRPRARQVLVDLVIVGGCFLLVVAIVLRGAGEGIQIDVSASANQTGVGRRLGGVTSIEAKAFVLVVSVGALLTRAVGTLALLASRDRRRDPLTWLLLGGSLAGAVAIAALYHSSASQYYFARSAIPMMALGSALGLVVLVDRLGTHARTVLPLGILAGVLIVVVPRVVLGDLGTSEIRQAAAMVGVAAVVLAVAGAVAAMVRPRRWSAVGATIILAVLAGGMTVVAKYMADHQWRASPAEAVAATAPGAVSRDQIDAARWIRDHSDADDMLMTNRHCVGARPPGGCSSRRFVVAAFSERQVLVEGWSYTPRMAELSRESGERYGFADYWEPELLALNDGFVTSPSAQAAAQLRELGVRWVYVDHTIPHAETLEPYATLRYSNPGVDVYELVASG